MKRLVLYAAICLPSPVAAQEILSFNVSHVHVARLNDGCLLTKIRATSPPQGSSKDWAATATYIYREIGKLNKFGHIEIDLRRGDEAERPRDESKLAHLGASAAASNCKEENRVEYFYVAERLLTQKDFAIRRVHLELSVLDVATADERTRKRFNLPRNWRLPNVGQINSPLVEPLPNRRARQGDAEILIVRIEEILAGRNLR